MVDSSSQSVVTDGEGKTSAENRGERSGELSVRVSSTSALEKEGRIDGEVDKADGEGERFVGEVGRSMREGERSMGGSERFMGEGRRSVGEGRRSMEESEGFVGKGRRSVAEGERSIGAMFETEGEDESEGDGERGAEIGPDGEEERIVGGVFETGRETIETGGRMFKMDEERFETDGEMVEMDGEGFEMEEGMFETNKEGDCDGYEEREDDIGPDGEEAKGLGRDGGK